MDINTLRGLSTVLVMIAFVGVCWWAFSPRRKQRFKEAANLPFDDDAVGGDVPPHAGDRRAERQDENPQQLHSSDAARQEKL
ncbi:cbb3-type cytochrome c oxidase subunit 3 [Exilibacterium tricleocarpae]|uniref:Cbb3-type cytochrome c oxidase subunit 3 n=2 Tax=Exilibacterium tricleocarpae TaxID=2591008 RepID=A0A545U5T4_9GAMM|nr:cbb3-type cytochrome c oxidase subunit 3 [Exilibacterium tricleocarpae]